MDTSPDLEQTLYRAFEEVHRGSRELILSRLKFYLPLIAPLKQIDPHPAGIDLGCGRGEWLELLQSAGFEPQGVDLDEGMLRACYDLGLRVTKGDALAFLDTLPETSQMIVSGFHIAEHLRFEDLTKLVQCAHRVLKPGGFLILETPNPENLVVGACSFYLDPTHRTPLPPGLLSFLPQYFGFMRTKVVRLNATRVLDPDSRVSLEDVFHSVSGDYAVIAQKRAGKAIIAATDSVFERDVGCNLDTVVRLFDEQARQSEQAVQQIRDFCEERRRVNNTHDQIRALRITLEEMRTLYAARNELLKLLRLYRKFAAVNKALRRPLRKVEDALRPVRRFVRRLQGRDAKPARGSDETPAPPGGGSAGTGRHPSDLSDLSAPARRIFRALKACRDKALG